MSIHRSNGILLSCSISPAVSDATWNHLITVRLLNSRSCCIHGRIHVLDSSVRIIPESLSLFFWGAQLDGLRFVSLARNLPVMRRKAEALKAGSISRAEYDSVDSMSRSKMYNIPNYVVSPFQVLILAICTAILYRLHANESVAKSNWGISVIIAFVSALGLVFALPWFVLEKRRPGQTPPANMNIIRAGLWQWGQTASHIWRLKQTLLYLIGELLRI